MILSYLIARPAFFIGKMAIPNTTPTPNELYNGEMKKMSDTELRVVLIVTRATLGWEIDKKTGMRKQEDWINKTQMIKKTGRSGRHISKAIDSCIKNNWIETRNKDGDILDTKNKRQRLGYGGKMYYRLGKKFLDKITPVSKGNSNYEIVCQKGTAKREQQKGNRNKRNTVTKETLLQKTVSKDTGRTPDTYGNSNINFLIGMLKEKYNLSILDGTDKENRRYCWLAIKKFKKEGVELIIKIGAKDTFWSNKITGFKTLYYNGVKIASLIKDNKSNVLIV